MANYLTTPLSGAITSQIASLTGNVINSLHHKDKYTVEQLMDLIELDPVAKACVEMKAQRATISIGDYTNKNKEIQTFIRSNINNMEGSFKDIVGRLCSAMPLGFSVGEIIFYNKGFSRFNNQSWRLKGINILDPRKISFEGSLGNVKYVNYDDGVKEVSVPYNKCIHITNGLTTNFNQTLLYGSPEMKRAYPFIKLKQLVFAEMGISAKTLATGILVGKTDSDSRVTLYGSNNQPIKGLDGQIMTVSAVENLSRQMRELENHAQIVTDKKNDIMPIQIPAGENFWNLALNLVNTQIMRSFGVPELAFSEGSGAMGVATLSQKHLSLLDATIEAVSTRIKDNLIEKVIRPLIVWNFGKQDDYGNFEYESATDPQQDSLITGNLISALSMQILSSQDLDVINALRERLKLPPLSEEQLAAQQALQQQQAQAAANPPQPEESTNTEYP